MTSPVVGVPRSGEGASDFFTTSCGATLNTRVRRNALGRGRCHTNSLVRSIKHSVEGSKKRRSEHRPVAGRNYAGTQPLIAPKPVVASRATRGQISERVVRGSI